MSCDSLFLFNATAPTEIYTLSLHDALPISDRRGGNARDGSSASSRGRRAGLRGPTHDDGRTGDHCRSDPRPLVRDRKSTRLNSSHSSISYAVFCLKKKKSLNA